MHLGVDVLGDIFCGWVLAAGGLVKWCGLVEVAVVELIEDGVECCLCGVEVADEAVLVEAVALDLDGCAEIVAVEGFLLSGDREGVGSGECGFDGYGKHGVRVGAAFGRGCYGLAKVLIV